MRDSAHAGTTLTPGTHWTNHVISTACIPRSTGGPRNLPSQVSPRLSKIHHEALGPLHNDLVFWRKAQYGLVSNFLHAQLLLFFVARPTHHKRVSSGKRVMNHI